jgi:hypothetical protein
MGMRIVKNSVIALAAAAALLGGIAQSFGVSGVLGMKYHATPVHVASKYHDTAAHVLADVQSPDMKYHT